MGKGCLSLLNQKRTSPLHRRKIEKRIDQNSYSGGWEADPFLNFHPPEKGGGRMKERWGAFTLRGKSCVPLFRGEARKKKIRRALFREKKWALLLVSHVKEEELLQFP